MRRPPSEGAAVFTPDPKDSRTLWSAPISESTEIRFRFPAICCGGGKPTRVEVIDLSARPQPQRPFADDPYKLGDDVI